MGQLFTIVLSHLHHFPIRPLRRTLVLADQKQHIDYRAMMPIINVSQEQKQLELCLKKFYLRLYRQTFLSMKLRLLICLSINLLLWTTTNAQDKTDFWLENLLRTHASPLLRSVLDKPDTFQYQVIYTIIDRDKNNKPHFKNYYLHVDKNRYFNPASTVKLPTALVALEKLNKLHIAGLTRNTAMLTDSAFRGQTSVLADSSASNKLPSIAHYIKKILLVSDNDAYNRLYEFDGQKFLNEALWKKGYTNTRITRRFVPMTEEENRQTNPIRFMKEDTLVYMQPAAHSSLQFDFSKRVLIGRAHYNRNEELINEPFDFTKHNNLPLEDLQHMLQSVVFPKSVSQRQRFDLTKNDQKFLLDYLAKLPGESSEPTYDTTEFFDSYTKFFLYRAGRNKIPSHVRIFNKPGWSYGFLTDAAYIVDFKHQTEFMLAAVIYVNSDGVLNDDKYEYEQIGYPFFKEIGEIIYDYELKRKRIYKPVLEVSPQP
jgi:hypothetical protein